MLILTATRNGNLTANPLMDSLFYHYASGTNRLTHVDDYGLTAYGVNTDIKDQDPDNYSYDANGNLKSNVSRLTNNIKWNVYGKIAEIEKGPLANAGSRHIYYNYDPSGNRIGVSHRYRTFDIYFNFTWYVRDAQGNVLAVYRVDETPGPSAGTLRLAEHHMYGSSRLGIINRDMDADAPKHTPENIDQLGNAYLINFTRGNKFFEITNHLGNVMLTVTDKRMPVPVSGNPSVIASYTADVATAVDYSPFGMSLPGRIYNNHWQKYRYGFNGQESDNEFYGPYNELDYGARVYDPRLGRFLSIDPLASKFPMLTPYQYASNSPIENSDLDGLESLSQIKANLEKQWRAQIQIKNSLDQRVPNLINSWRTSENQYSSFQFGATPQYSPEMKERKDAEWRAYLRNNGYNDDGSKPPMMRIAENKTFNKFSENIALPTLEIASYVGFVGEMGALMKAANNVFKGLAFRQANVKAEELTFELLQTRFPASKGYDILQKPKLKYDEISGSFYPDFLVMNRSEKSVVAVIDSKGASGKLTGQQKPFFNANEKATIAEGQYQGVNIDPAQSQKKTVNWDRKTGDKTFTTY